MEAPHLDLLVSCLDSRSIASIYVTGPIACGKTYTVQKAIRSSANQLIFYFDFFYWCGIEAFCEQLEAFLAERHSLVEQLPRKRRTPSLLQWLLRTQQSGTGCLVLDHCEQLENANYLPEAFAKMPGTILVGRNSVYLLECTNLHRIMLPDVGKVQSVKILSSLLGGSVSETLISICVELYFRYFSRIPELLHIVKRCHLIVQESELLSPTAVELGGGKSTHKQIGDLFRLIQPHYMQILNSIHSVADASDSYAGLPILCRYLLIAAFLLAVTAASKTLKSIASKEEQAVKEKRRKRSVAKERVTAASHDSTWRNFPIERLFQLTRRLLQDEGVTAVEGDANYKTAEYSLAQSIIYLEELGLLFIDCENLRKKSFCKCAISKDQVKRIAATVSFDLHLHLASS